MSKTCKGNLEVLNIPMWIFARMASIVDSNEAEEEEAGGQYQEETHL